MKEQQNYIIHMDKKFGFLQLIDVPKLIEDCTETWYNQTLCQVNDCVVRLGVFKEGEFHWHKHDNEDEFFFVLEGELTIELEDGKAVLKPHQGYNIPKGVVHRPKVAVPTSVLMMEGASVKPTGD